MSDNERKPAQEMTGKELAAEWKACQGQSRVEALLLKAAQDSDLVSMFSFIGERQDDAECAVVVLRDRDVLRCFRDWAARNGVLTPGKPVTQ